MLTPIIDATAENRDSRALTAALEDGAVLLFGTGAFVLRPEEEMFRQRLFASGKTKNVSLRGDGTAPRGAAGSPEEQEALGALLARFRTFSQNLVGASFPGYAPRMRLAQTSYRPFEVEGRVTSWRKDDARLHVDAFPSNPVGRNRILRVFFNLNSAGQPRVWRVGEDFASMAERFLPRVTPYSRAGAAALAALGITKSRRSEYDHVMLHLHDALKRDAEYQAAAPQQVVEFAPGQVWVTFSDAVLHSVLRGRYMLEQTIQFPLDAQQDPDKSPYRIIERKLGRSLH
jgi:hypothetical protein